MPSDRPAPIVPLRLRIIDVDCPVTDTTCVPGDPRYELGSFGDAICVYRSVAPTMGAAWEFRPDVSIAACDFPAGFNPSTFSN